jgi:hypothetical protein
MKKERGERKRNKRKKIENPRNQQGELVNLQTVSKTNT